MNTTDTIQEATQASTFKCNECIYLTCLWPQAENSHKELTQGFRNISGTTVDNALLSVSDEWAPINLTDHRHQKLGIERVAYIVTEETANRELQHIVAGVVGFDTEFVKRAPTATERLILDMKTPSATRRKAVKSIIQYPESVSEGGYQIDWGNMGLCLVQICAGQTVRC